MIQVTAKVDDRALNAYLKRLDKNRDKPLRTRAERTTNAASKLLVPPLRANIPAGQASPFLGVTAGRSGNLRNVRRRRGNARRMVGTKLLRKRGGEDIRPTWVGSKAWYFRFPTQGTRAHSLAPRAGRGQYAVFGVDEVRPLAGITVRGITPRSWVIDAAASHQGSVVRRIEKDVWDVR